MDKNIMVLSKIDRIQYEDTECSAYVKYVKKTFINWILGYRSKYGIYYKKGKRPIDQPEDYFIVNNEPIRKPVVVITFHERSFSYFMFDTVKEADEKVFKLKKIIDEGKVKTLDMIKFFGRKEWNP